MSKTLNATCALGIVTCEGFEVPTAEVFSEGVAASEGVLILDEDNAFYLAKTSPDLKTALTAIADALGEIATGLTDIGAGMLGPATAPPVTLPATVAAITTIATQLSTLKEALR